MSWWFNIVLECLDFQSFWTALSPFIYFLYSSFLDLLSFVWCSLLLVFGYFLLVFFVFKKCCIIAFEMKVVLDHLACLELVLWMHLFFRCYLNQTSRTSFIPSPRNTFNYFAVFLHVLCPHVGYFGSLVFISLDIW